MEYNKFIDHTLLKPDATIEGITKLCQEARQYDFMELTSKIVQNDEAPAAYPWLLAALKAIKSGVEPLTVGLIYFAHLLNNGGIGLDVDECVVCHGKSNIVAISYEDGGFICRDCYDPETMDATAHLDLSEQDLDDLITYFKDNKIDVVSDEEEADDIDHIKVNEAEIAKAEKEVEEDEADEDEAVETEKEEVASIEEFSKIPTGEVKVNDSVKMYLKEIGKVPLLTAKEETELAKRIAAGDKEAKDQLINANLRLVISIAKHYVGRGMRLLWGQKSEKESQSRYNKRTMSSFSAFNLSPRLVSALAKLGYTEPSPVQANVIPKALKGTSLICQSETGSGKTHAYLIPILEKIDPNLPRLQDLVICPSRELARQVYEFAKPFERFFPRLKIRLFTSESEKSQNSEGLSEAPQLVIGTPGRLKDMIPLLDFGWNGTWFGLVIGALVIGAVAGFFGARAFFKREIQKNPPINEKMVRAMSLALSLALPGPSTIGRFKTKSLKKPKRSMAPISVRV